MTLSFRVRPATVADAALLARHRAAMFLDMGRLALEGEAIVLNVFVEPAWRRRGVGEALMQAILEGLTERNVRRVVLHASDSGRPPLERLGFVPTNEMRLDTPRHR